MTSISQNVMTCCEGPAFDTCSVRTSSRGCPPGTLVHAVNLKNCEKYLLISHDYEKTLDTIATLIVAARFNRSIFL